MLLGLGLVAPPPSCRIFRVGMGATGDSINYVTAQYSTRPKLIAGSRGR